MSEFNEQLREHVTSTGFALVLGKTHIATLVELDNMLRRNQSSREEFANGISRRAKAPRAFTHFVPAIGGLMTRGLVERIIDDAKTSGAYINIKPRRIWRITPAGRLVIKLLQEAGIYEEYAAHLPPIPAKATRETAVAS